MTAEEFNKKHQVGTPVKYFPVRGRDLCITTSTSSIARTLSSGEHVVWIEGRPGCVSLENVKVLTGLEAQ